MSKNCENKQYFIVPIVRIYKNFLNGKNNGNKVDSENKDVIYLI